MRVTYLSPSAELGGAERCLLDLMAAVRDASPDDELSLVTAGDGPLVARAAALGVTSIALPMPPALRGFGDSALGLGRRRWLPVVAGTRAAVAGAGYAVRLRRAIATLRPHVIHSNGMKFHLLGALACGGATPVLWHLRDFVGSRRLMASALRLAAPRARSAIAISGAVAADARRCMPTLPVEVCYDAIDVAEFSPASVGGSALDALAGLPPAPAGTIRVGLVATYARWKGQDLFLRAVSRALAALPGARFYVAGGPIYATHGSQFSRDELARLAGALGLRERVGFLPFQADPAWLFRALDVVVHASTRPEPFGRTIAEGMACGRAVIATRDAGAAELVHAGLDAELYPAGDEEALSRAMIRLAGDAGIRGRMGEAARATALSRFSRRRLGNELVALYARAAACTAALGPEGGT